jgi:hypothetical protein
MNQIEQDKTIDIDTSQHHNIRKMLSKYKTTKDLIDSLERTSDVYTIQHLLNFAYYNKNGTAIPISNGTLTMDQIQKIVEKEEYYKALDNDFKPK